MSFGFQSKRIGEDSILEDINYTVNTSKPKKLFAIMDYNDYPGSIGRAIYADSLEDVMKWIEKTGYNYHEEYNIIEEVHPITI